MTARQTAITGIATHRPAKTQDYLESAGADIYGQYVFNDVAQRKYLAKATYQGLRRTIDYFDRLLSSGAMAPTQPDWSIDAGRCVVAAAAPARAAPGAAA